MVEGNLMPKRNVYDPITLEEILLRIQDKTGSCMFEIGTPPDNGTKWEVVGYGGGRFTALGDTVMDAALKLEKVMQGSLTPDVE